MKRCRAAMPYVRPGDTPTLSTLSAVVVVLLILLLSLTVQAQVSVQFEGAIEGVEVRAAALQRQYDIKGTVIVDSADENYDIEVRVVPDAGWHRVEMNTNHPGISAINDYNMGFDVSITPSGDLPAGGACDPGAWCQGHAKLENEAAGTGVRYDIHVRLVLVDEPGTAAYDPGGDNVRFASLPSGPLTVTVEVLVTEVP